MFTAAVAALITLIGVTVTSGRSIVLLPTKKSLTPPITPSPTQRRKKKTNIDLTSQGLNEKPLILRAAYPFISY
jgi:hypothetical protein